MKLELLVAKIKQCRECSAVLPCPPNPLPRVGGESARVLIIGQAPGEKAHLSGTPWNDLSGDRLRAWMGLDQEQFADPTRIAIMPMGFCFPGRGKSGDLPPRPECAPLWHDRILRHLSNIRLTRLIGRYAQERYLGGHCKATLGETVKAWREYRNDGYLPLVHPSPRNQIWLRKNPWFDEETVPYLKETITRILKK